MSYIPNFLYIEHDSLVLYPFGANWNNYYIHELARIIYDTYKEDISNRVNIGLVARGSSGCMIAGAIINELYNYDPFMLAYILVSRKKDERSHIYSLAGIECIQHNMKLIIVDDFISSGATITAIIEDLDKCLNTPSRGKYDMLCVSNHLSTKCLKKNTSTNYKKWREICSRFKYIVCCPKEK